MRRMAPSRTDSVLILGVPVSSVQRAPSPHDGAFNAQGPAPSKTLYVRRPRKYASTLTYTDSRLCAVRHAPVGALGA